MLGIYAPLTECFPLKGMPLCMISRIGKSQNEENKDKFACYGHIYNLRVCPHSEPWNQCLGPGTKWCCVHTVSTRYATAYIVTPFLSVRRHFFKNMSLATITKPWTATELKNGVHTGTQCPILCPSTRSRPCTRAPAPCPNSSSGTRKKGVFTLVPSEQRTQALCPGTKCERSRFAFALPQTAELLLWVSCCNSRLLPWKLSRVRQTPHILN